MHGTDGSNGMNQVNFVVIKIEESVKDRIKFLSANKRYAKIFDPKVSGNLRREAINLQKAGYAGNNPFYADALIEVANGPTMRRALYFARRYHGY